MNWRNPSPGLNREKRCLAEGYWRAGTFFPIPKDGGEIMANHTFFRIGEGYTADSHGYNAFVDAT